MPRNVRSTNHSEFAPLTLAGFYRPHHAAITTTNAYCRLFAAHTCRPLQKTNNAHKAPLNPPPLAAIRAPIVAIATDALSTNVRLVPLVHYSSRLIVLPAQIAAGLLAQPEKGLPTTA